MCNSQLLTGAEPALKAVGLLLARGLGAQGVFTPSPRKPAQPRCTSWDWESLLAAPARSALIHRGAAARTEAR